MYYYMYMCVCVMYVMLLYIYPTARYTFFILLFSCKVSKNLNYYLLLFFKRSYYPSGV